jgi:hypothetical protein
MRDGVCVLEKMVAALEFRAKRQIQPSVAAIAKATRVDRKKPISKYSSFLRFLWGGRHGK